MALRKNMGEKYSPVLFLASLGNGGMAVAFYVFLHFMIKHLKMTTPGHEKPITIPLAEFGAVKQALTGGHLLTSILVGLALVGIVVFAVRHYFFLFWNLSEFKIFKQTPAFGKLMNSNQEISLAAIPLTLAMSINVFFVVAAVFIPGLWKIVEYLFPGALIGFFLVGIYAIKIVVTFMTWVLSSGEFDTTKNNSLSMMIGVFAFSMVAVGFAAPGAMSNTLVTSSIGIIGSTFFTSATVLLGLMTLFKGLHSMVKHGISKENSPTLWILIPILTLVGISVVRVDHGLHMNLKVHTQPGEMFINLFIFTSLQILFGVLGWYVMKQVKYFEEFVHGEGRSHTSYALICPGVAFFVFGMFTLHMGLVRMHVVPKFGVAYWILMAGLVYILVRTIMMIFKLDKKLLID